MQGAELVCFLIGVVLGAGAWGCSGTPVSCEPCRPGTQASNPAVPCSACVPIDGGADAAEAG
jgi:hypothetical protein